MKILNQLPRQACGFDWDTLFDGQVRLLEKGVDFNCKVTSMRGNIYASARRRNLK